MKARLKEHLLINYLALGVGFTALFIASFVTRNITQKGRIFEQSTTLPLGKLEVRMETVSYNQDGLQVKFSLVAKENVTQVSMFNFRFKAEDITNNLNLEMENFTPGLEIETFCRVLVANGQGENSYSSVDECLADVIKPVPGQPQVYELNYFSTDIVTGLTMEAGSVKTLFTANFKVTNYPSRVKVTVLPPSLAADGQGESYWSGSYTIVTANDSEENPGTDYALVSADGVVLEAGEEPPPPEAPTNTPVPTATPTTPPTEGGSQYEDANGLPPNPPDIITAEYDLNSNKLVFEWRWKGDLAPEGKTIAGYCQPNGVSSSGMDCDNEVNPPFWWHIIEVDADQSDDTTVNNDKIVFKSYSNRPTDQYEVRGDASNATEFKINCTSSRSGRTYKLEIATRDAAGNMDLSKKVSAQAACPALGGQVIEGAALELQTVNGGVDVYLVTANANVDSLDLVFKYNQQVSFNPDNIFTIGDDMGSSARVSRRFVSNVNRRLIVNITGVQLQRKPEGRYYVGRLNLQESASVDQETPLTIGLVYQPNSTTDTNVNIAGRDVLTEVRGDVSIVIVPPPTEATPTTPPEPTTPPGSEPGAYNLDEIKLVIPVYNKDNDIPSADVQTLPAMAWLIDNDDQLHPMWWKTSSGQWSPFLWLKYQGGKTSEAYLMAEDIKFVTNFDLTNKAVKGAFVKLAGYLGSEIRTNTVCEDNSYLPACGPRIRISTGLDPGDVGLSSQNSQVSSYYKAMLDRSSLALFETNLISEAVVDKWLKWFGEDYVNAFDTGLYVQKLSDLDFKIDWVEGVEAGDYAQVPTDNEQVMEKTRLFNLLDLDGNRFINALDWSLAATSYAYKGALYEKLNPEQ